MDQSPLSTFIHHENSAVAEMAALLEEARIAYENGDMTKDEFDEIANDIIEFSNVNELANDIDERKFWQQTKDAIWFIIQQL
jgi:type IV secretory pathway VirD2 relaxase